ncbi:MAG: OmpH family outer membrane protein [Crocinitomicaceae bacterium]|nr:OmpH family outer membrane protein [Crocinitomicaceae bacterium]
MDNNKLAKISLGINAVLVIAVIILFVKMPGGNSANDLDIPDSLSTKVNFEGDGLLNIAYYNSDTITSKSDFVQEIQKEIEASNKRGQDEMQAKQREIERWQKKWEDMGTLLPREQEQYYSEAQQKQMEAAQFEQNLQMKIAGEQETLMLTLYKRLQKYAKSFCEENEIDMLISFQMATNIIYVNPEFDVTKQFLNHVNKEYKKTSSGNGSEEEEEDK